MGFLIYICILDKGCSRLQKLFKFKFSNSTSKFLSFEERFMKRTKQRADRCGQAKPEHVSGCRQFEGEDLGYFDRMAMNAALQREWADQRSCVDFNKQMAREKR